MHHMVVYVYIASCDIVYHVILSCDFGHVVWSCDLFYLVIPADSGAIPVEFTSHLPWNFNILVISLESSDQNEH